jgi:starch phosphorylase
MIAIDSMHLTPDPKPKVGYFCMEYGLGETLPLYAGGLGILAGDHLKAAGDLGLPLTAIGILWRHGYSRQWLDGNGVPRDADDTRDLSAHLAPTGIRIEVPIWGRPIRCDVWRASGFACAPLYLLEPTDETWITNRLYGGPAEHRVAQEMLLGIGGVRTLDALGIEPDVYHFNEGHAVFAGLELLSQRMAELGNRPGAFEEAWQWVRERVVFTTHTPVEAGNESHPLDLLMGLGANCGLSREQLAALGGDPFNMTVAGLRLARAANAVSALHGDTARKMWQGITDAAPIGAITNGVHLGTWQDASIRAAETDAEVWDAHQLLKRGLITEVARRSGVQLRPEGLLVGFARRAASYKRSDLILRQPDRLAAHLREGRLQIVFAGKSHPADEHGRQILTNLVQLSRQFPESVVFLADYSIGLSQQLTRGCDVWLNNPRRPLEASGTSGMKAALNGVLNVSILDGWWPEACENGVNGWHIGEATEHADVTLGDELDMKALHDVIDGDVLPAYQDRVRWVRMMRASIRMAERGFSAKRMVQQYADELYQQVFQQKLAVG